MSGLRPWSNLSVCVRSALIVLGLAGVIAALHFVDWYQILFGDHRKVFHITQNDCASQSALVQGMKDLRSNIMERIKGTSKYSVFVGV